jgi:hypothetical protein
VTQRVVLSRRGNARSRVHLSLSNTYNLYESGPERTFEESGSMDFCDLGCKFAAFPKSEAIDGSGSCRTFIALYCKKKKRLVHKNLPCAQRQDAGSGRNRRGRRQKP